MTSKDAAFSGSVPLTYETHLVPLIFEPYAEDIVKRLAPRKPRRILEVAAGTGVVTRAMSAALPGVAIVATDLNPAMLDQARAVGTKGKVEWQQADGQQLPFPDASFDAVVCQFGVMFFPDKARGYAEARRVLKPGGSYVFNVWDRIEANEFPDVITQALARHFPKDPPKFLSRTPHGYHDRAAIAREITAAGFKAHEIATVAVRAYASMPSIAAVAYCQGTPLRAEIEARDAKGLQAATAAATAALAQRFGSGAIDGKLQAHVITATP
ncbi:MAG: class I SAM-dependent methyltransferase [Gammaproteobacteria bacterium]